MQIPLRILRAHAEAQNMPIHPPTPRQLETRRRIVALSLSLLAEFGRAALTTGRLAEAMAIGLPTFRRHFADIDALLAHIIGTELARLHALIAAVEAPPERLHAARRAAFRDATRAGDALTPAYRLVALDLALLPEDLRIPLEATRAALGAALAGPHGAQALALLETAGLTQTEVETILAGLAPPVAAQAAPQNRAEAAPENTPQPAPRGAAEPVPPSVPQPLPQQRVEPRARHPVGPAEIHPPCPLVPPRPGMGDRDGGGRPAAIGNQQGIDRRAA